MNMYLIDIDKMEALQKALHNMEGETIPYNIITRYLSPLSNWVDNVLGIGADDDERDEGEGN